MDKKKITSFIIVAIFLAVVFFLVSHSAQSLNVKNIKYVNIAGQSIRVDLALTKETQTQGLSGRGVLKDNEGMLFVFNHPGEYRFWMKDMNFPIDIVWMNENRNVVYVEKKCTTGEFSGDLWSSCQYEICFRGCVRFFR